MKKYTAIGIMSGSSLDGVDIAYCEFTNSSTWKYNILFAETVSYSHDWLTILNKLPNGNAETLIECDIKYGKLLADMVNRFIKKHKLSPDIISSHGHTIFHNPSKSYTFQLGNGQAIASSTNITTVSDFRIGDILLNGQGAPLVPIGDELLFNEYDFCVNIGGIANISFNKNGKRLAYDICPANQLLNYLSRTIGKKYDNNGDIAKSGKTNNDLLYNLNQNKYYSLPYPKSLSNQYVTNSFIPILDNSNIPIEDKLNTVCKHISNQITVATNTELGGNVLITGGGAHNSFLIDSIKEEISQTITVPELKIIDFKEALIFAFMGLLKIHNKINCLSSSTGAKKDSSSGVIYNP